MHGMANFIFGSKINCQKKSWSLWFPVLDRVSLSGSSVPLFVPGGVSGISWAVCCLHPCSYLGHVQLLGVLGVFLCVGLKLFCAAVGAI